tara:strand:+ start:29074 stop:29301 length:228 start_codon:yes stop_codon:yes gene_type:complete
MRLASSSASVDVPVPVPANRRPTRPRLASRPLARDVDASDAARARGDVSAVTARRSAMKRARATNERDECATRNE